MGSSDDDVRAAVALTKMGSSDDAAAASAPSSDDNPTTTTTTTSNATTTTASADDSATASDVKAAIAFDAMATITTPDDKSTIAAAEDKATIAAAEDKATIAAPDDKASSSTGNKVKGGAVELPPCRDPPLYLRGDNVLAFHDNKVYKATVIWVDIRHNQWIYLVRNKGWSKKSGEWVGADRLMKETPENLNKQLKINIEAEQKQRESQIKSKVFTEDAAATVSDVKVATALDAMATIATPDDKVTIATPDDKATSSTDNEVKGGGVELPPPSDAPLYSDGENVLAFHGNKVYQAKVIRVFTRGNQWAYYVQYKGWGKMSGEWVGADRLMKKTPENLEKGLKINVEEERKQVLLESQTKPKVSTEDAAAIASIVKAATALDAMATIAAPDDKATSSTANEVKGGAVGLARPSNSPLYSEGENVFAFHSNKVYQAKVIRVYPGWNQWAYFVHYKGCSKKSGEWVGADRLMKETPENLEKRLKINVEEQKQALCESQIKSKVSTEDIAATASVVKAAIVLDATSVIAPPDDKATVAAPNDKATSSTDKEVIGGAVELPPPSDSPLYSEGENLLAFHTNKVYQAKVVKVDTRWNQWAYYVHYKGWSKNWDEWVGVDRLMKETHENVLKQLEINAEEERIQALRESQIKSKVSTGGRGKKRKKSFFLKGENTFPRDKLMKIHIPSTLKKQLVDDCDFITHLSKLVKLPRTPNVDAILNQYLDYRLKKDGMIADSVGEVVNGIRCYFDKALPLTLLYQKERQQFQNLDSARAMASSTVYGAEHLLRLFVKLPDLLYNADMEEKTLTELQLILVDFLKFLQKNQSSFFLSTYVPQQEVTTSLGVHT